MKLVLTCALTGALIAAACGGGSGKKSTPTAVRATPGASSATAAAGSPTARPATAAASTPAAAPTAKTGGTKTYASPPPMTIDPNKQYFATIKTDVGDIRIQLFAKDAPRSVNSFVFLARDRFYDGLTFHRVIAGFVAQGGDPEGTGRGGPGYNVPDEVNANKFEDGSVGMAKTAAPDSAGSQFFIDYAPQPSLDGKYTVFGKVVAGRDVLDKIKPRDPSTATTPGTVINTIEIEEQ